MLKVNKKKCLTATTCSFSVKCNGELEKSYMVDCIFQMLQPQTDFSVVIRSRDLHLHLPGSCLLRVNFILDGLPSNRALLLTLSIAQL
jgi:hypothetical protein